MARGDIDTQEVESRAVEKVKERIWDARDRGLRPELAENDRTPSFDGQIEINNSPSGSINGGIKLVRVQVKGKTVTRLDSRVCVFPVKVSALRTFEQNGGALFFVVEFTKDFLGYRIFYRAFDPLNAAHLIQASGKGTGRPKKQVSLDFRQLPEDKDELRRIVDMSYESRDNHFWLDKDPHAYSDGTRFTIQSVVPLTPKDFTPGTLIDFTQGTQRLLFTGKDGGLIPSKITSMLVFRSPDNLTSSVTVGEDTYELHVSQKPDTDKIMLIIGPVSFAWSVGDAKSLFGRHEDSPKPIPVKTTINISEELSSALRDLRFLKSLVDNNGKMDIAGSLGLVVNSLDEGTLSERISQQLERYSRLEKLLKVLGIETAKANVTKIEQEGGEYLDPLYHALVLKEPLQRQQLGEPARKLIRFGDYLLDLVVMNAPEMQNQYRLFDVYAGNELHAAAEEQSLQSDINPRGTYQTSVFAIVNMRELAIVSNLHLDTVVQAFSRAKEDNDKTFGDLRIKARDVLFNDALNTALKLMLAADSIATGEVKTPEHLLAEKWRGLLDASLQLIGWLDTGASGMQDLLAINRMQVKFRLCDFTDRDSALVMEILKRRQEPDVRTACYLLVGDIKQARKESNLLPEDKLEQMKSFPIGHLFQPDKITASKSISSGNAPAETLDLLDVSDVEKRKLAKQGKLTPTKAGLYNFGKQSDQ